MEDSRDNPEGINPVLHRSIVNPDVSRFDFKFIIQSL